MLSGPQQKFCEGIVSGLNATEAYAAAYECTEGAARRSGSRLLTNVDIGTEIARLRDAAAHIAGSAVLTLAEKRSFLARLVRARPALLDRDSDLWQSIKVTEDATEMKLPDKLAAIREDNDLAGEGSEAGANDELAAMLKRLNAVGK